MIGGFDDQNNTIVWKYHLKTTKWMKIMRLPFFHDAQTVLLTSDERYIIVSDLHSLYGLEITENNYKLYESPVKVPSVEAQFMTMIGGVRDELLVIGWIKLLFKSSEFKYMEEPPKYLKVLISQWYSQEEIHFIGKATRRHFTISMKHIVSSLIFNKAF